MEVSWRLVGVLVRHSGGFFVGWWWLFGHGRGVMVDAWTEVAATAVAVVGAGHHFWVGLVRRRLVGGNGGAVWVTCDDAVEGSRWSNMEVRVPRCLAVVVWQGEGWGFYGGRRRKLT